MPKATEEIVPITVYMKREDAARIAEWADKFGHSTSKFTRYIIEDAIVETGMAYDILGSRIGLKIIDMVRQWRERHGEAVTVETKSGAVPAA